MRPSQDVNDILGGVLARSLNRHSPAVTLHAYVFASNHLHLIVRARNGSLPSFMRYLLGNISKKLGGLIGWENAFWGRRYSAEPILDDAASVDRLRYILSHGVKENLVSRVAEWPGLTCLRQLLDEEPRSYPWFNWTKRWRRRASGGALASRFDPAIAEPEELRVVPLPIWADRPPAERRTEIEKIVTSIETAHRGATVLGVVGVLSASRMSAPARPKRSPRPSCHTTERQLRRDYEERLRTFGQRYHAASAAWRSGDAAAVFPIGSFRPPPVLTVAEPLALAG